MPVAPASQTGDPLRREIERVTDRLRSWSVERCERPGPDGVTPAQRAHDCAQRLADLAADASGRERRPVPHLAAHAAADQVAVTAHDVLVEGDLAAVDAALDLLTALRRTL